MAARPVAIDTSAIADSGKSVPSLSGSMILRIAPMSSRVAVGKRTVTSKRFSPSQNSLAVCPPMAVSM